MTEGWLEKGWVSCYCLTTVDCSGAVAALVVYVSYHGAEVAVAGVAPGRLQLQLAWQSSYFLLHGEALPCHSAKSVIEN